MKRFLPALLCALAFFATAASADTGEYFFKNNISNDTRLIEMKMLGAHDAFTASLNSKSAVDEAGKKLGDSGSKLAAIFWTNDVVATSKTQSANVEELLERGVRYFDVRLSRYKSGGEFYTTHGRISDQFTGEGGIARKISSWAAAHPGEIIVLDFQSLFDIQTDSGGADRQSWRDLINKLEQDGITSYVYTRDGSIIDYTYGGLTNNSTRAAIVLFGQITGSWEDSRFINRRDSDGYVRSFDTEDSSYSGLIEGLGQEVADIRANTEGYYYKYRIMQAKVSGGLMNLINAANQNNIKLLNEESFDDWLQVLPVLMVDNATSEERGFNALAVEKLAKANRAAVGGKYRSTSGIVTLSGSNDNVPLGAKFVADISGDTVSLYLDSGEPTKEMTAAIAPCARVRRVYDKNGELVAQTAADGGLEFKTTLPAVYRLEETDIPAPFAVTKPMLRYSFTDESGLRDISGNGYDAFAEGSPKIGEGRARLSPGNVIRLPFGLTKNMKNYTVASWVYVNTPVNGSRLFDIGRNARGSVFARVSAADTSAGYKNTETKQASGGAVAAGRWVHIANTYNSVGKTLSLYVDGRLVSSASALENPAPDSINDYLNPNGSYIGRTQWYFIEANRSDNPDINADVADFRIYDSVLSANEIARLAREVKVSFVDENKKTIGQSVTVPVGTAYNGLAQFPLIEGYSLVGVEGVSDVAVSNEILVRYKLNKPEIVVTVSDGQGIVRLNGPTDGLEGAKLIGAVYSVDGRLVRAATADAGVGQLELLCEEGCTVKGFLWDAYTMEPKIRSNI